MTSGTQVASATLPAGALAPNGDLIANPSPGVTAQISWGGISAGGTAYLLSNVLSNVGGPPASGSSGPHQFLITFTASAPVPAYVAMSRSTQVSPGQPWPTVAIDVGNDGTVDVPNLLGSGVTSSMIVGPQPLVLRVILASQLTTNGISSTYVDFSLLPANNVTIVQNAVGCVPTNFYYDVDVGPTFLATGVMALLYPSPDLRVFVFGFTQQPTLLPPVLGQTCLLVPSPDVLLLAPTSMFVGVVVPLPAAVRPATFYVQAIGLSPTLGLATGDGFTVVAL
jgi:hypothetical protein